MNHEVLLACANVSVVSVKSTCVGFHIFMNRKDATPTVVGATSAFYAYKTARRLWACMINTAIAIAGFVRHCL